MKYNLLMLCQTSRHQVCGGVADWLLTGTPEYGLVVVLLAVTAVLECMMKGGLPLQGSLHQVSLR